MSTDPHPAPLAPTSSAEAPLEAVLVPPAAPLAGAARAPTIDALRGLALLGVAAVNLPIMFGPDERVFSLAWAESEAPRALAAIHLLFAGKGYALLSFLFGAGLALQHRRLGPRAGEVLPRRLGALAAIGAAHGLLLWHGDILAGYATLGLLWLGLLAGRSASTRARWGLALFAVLPLLVCAVGGALVAADVFLPGGLAKAREAALAEVDGSITRALEVYGSGSFGQLARFRAAAFLKTYLSTFAYLPQFLALFLAGGWAVERGLLLEPEAHRPLLARLAAAGIVLGAAGELAVAALGSGGLGRLGQTVLAQGIHAASAPALALGVAAALLLAWSNGRARLLLSLAPLGRLSLTAYLSQSLLFTTVAYAYGGGLYGRVTPDVCLALAVATWLTQALLAGLWVTRFERGPAEWLWRRMTYGR